MKPTNKQIKSYLSEGYDRYKGKMPDREKVDFFDWELDFEQNDDWTLWEREMIQEYGW